MDVLLLSQLLFSAGATGLSLVLIKKLRIPSRTSYYIDDSGLRRFPPFVRRLLEKLLFLSPFIRRFVRPSVAVRRELDMLGFYPAIDDVLFSRLQWVCALTVVITTAALFSFLLLLVTTEAAYFFLAVGAGMSVLCLILPRVWLRDQVVLIQRGVLRELPSFLDVLALVLESGQNFQSALQLALQHLSTDGQNSALKRQLQAVIQDIRAGIPKSIALQKFSDRVGLAEISQFSSSIKAADQQGVSVTGLLRRQAEQLRISRALAAERQAMKLPVKLLMPLAICIFPCTFLILAVPLVSRLAGSGLF